jgi:Ala-tRNA(Pro) deacylase
MTACDRRVDLKLLGKAIGASKLRFAVAAQLEALLGVNPGAVTVLGLLNDREQRVRLLVDDSIWDAGYFLCHPMVNTATLVVSKSDLLAFLALTGHSPQLFDLPQPAE